ncbi:MAG: hypothetical protein U0168_26205 [Nannocystaceae bacterium]
MDQAGLVRRLQAAAGVEEHRDNLRPRSRRLLEPLAQGSAGHDRHREEHAATVDADVEHRHHVGVAEQRERLGFAQQLGARARLGRGAAQDLERHGAAQLGVAGGVDRGHAADPDDLVDGVAAQPLARCQHPDVAAADRQRVGDPRHAVAGGRVRGVHQRPRPRARTLVRAATVTSSSGTR